MLDFKNSFLLNSLRLYIHAIRSSSIFISPRANNNNIQYKNNSKAGNQKGNAHHAGHLWNKQKNNYLTIS